MIRTATFITILFLASALMAQVPQSPTAGLTPNAKSFQRYGDIPVSLYTGTPNISIPLVSLRDGELSQSIALSYHSGGIKADEHPGWVGLGWTLMVGGAITREKNDLPDELDQRGFIYSHGAINGLDRRPWILDSLRASYGESIYFSLDLQPDKFNFRLPGVSGFFMMDAKGKWVVSCERPIKVERYSLDSPFNINQRLFPSSNSKIFSVFVLTDEHGIKYTFGEDAIDLGINIRSQASPAWEASAWHLKRIEHPNGDCVEFTYERSDFIVNFTNSSYGAYYTNSKGIVIAANISDEGQGLLNSPVYLKAIDGKTFRVAMDYSASKELNYSELDYQKRLAVDFDRPECRPIYFPGSTIKQQMENVKWQQLNAIRLYDKSMLTGTPFRRISFSYSDNTNMRLILKRVDIAGSDNNIYESYSFGYDYPELMPPYLSNKTDHWGYYNDVLNTDIDSVVIDKEPNPRTMLFGSLREITYPTGGKTLLEFEPHTYSRITNASSAGSLSETDEDHIAGGIRIKRIINVPNDGTEPCIKEYIYTKGYRPGMANYRSSGILECPPEYKIIVHEKGGGFITELSDRPLSNVINSYGHHIGYPEVVERSDKSGYMIQRFTSCEEIGFKDSSPIYSSHSLKFIPLSSKAAYRGRTISEQFYNEDGRLLKERTSYFEPNGVNESYVHSLYYSMCGIAIQGSKGGQVGYERFSIYKHFTYNLVNTSVREIIYDQKDKKNSTATSRFLTYNIEGQLKSDSLVTILQGNSVTDVTTYNYEWEENDEFKQRHLRSTLRETIKRHNGKTVGRIASRNRLEGKIPYVSEVIDHCGIPRTLYRCIEVDRRGRPLLTANSDRLWTAYFWGEHSICPIAEIKLQNQNDYDKIKDLTVPVDYQDETSFATFLNSICRILPDAMVTGYACTPQIGITCITNPSGNATYYLYDSFGQLSTIKDGRDRTITSYIYSTATDGSPLKQSE